MKYTLINPYIVTPNYVWCEDVQIKFFDTQTFFVNEVVPYSDYLQDEDFNVVFSVDKNTDLHNVTPPVDGSGSGIF